MKTQTSRFKIGQSVLVGGDRSRVGVVVAIYQNSSGMSYEVAMLDGVGVYPEERLVEIESEVAA